MTLALEPGGGDSSHRPRADNDFGIRHRGDTGGPGPTTAVVRGNNGTGVGLVEVYDLNTATVSHWPTSARVVCRDRRERHDRRDHRRPGEGEQQDVGARDLVLH